MRKKDLKTYRDIEAFQLGECRILAMYDEIFVFDASDTLFIRFPRNNRNYDEFCYIVFSIIKSVDSTMLMISTLGSRCRLAETMYGVPRWNNLIKQVHSLKASPKLCPTSRAIESSKRTSEAVA